MGMTLEPWQQRVVEERAQLADRLDKLGKAIRGPLLQQLPPVDAQLLFDQERAMDAYLKALDARIARFNHGS